MDYNDVKGSLEELDKDRTRLKAELNRAEKDNGVLKERVRALQRELYAIAVLFVGVAGVNAYFLLKVRRRAN